MKRSMTDQIKSFLTRGLTPTLLATVILLLGASPASAGGGNEGNPGVLPPQSRAFGLSYGEWSAAWWQWFMAHPMTGHPGVDDPAFDVSSGQQGKVWFLAGVYGTVERTISIPAGKALFIAVMNAECSSLEDVPFHGVTAKEQGDCAKFWNDHNTDRFCEIDGEVVKGIESYRVTSPQYPFIAPTPWIFGSTGGAGTAVADGCYLLVTPLSRGRHTIHFGGTTRYTVAQDGFDGDFPIDMTYHVSVK